MLIQNNNISSVFFSKEYDNENNMIEINNSFNSNKDLFDAIKIIENQNINEADEDILLSTQNFSLSIKKKDNIDNLKIISKKKKPQTLSRNNSQSNLVNNKAINNKTDNKKNVKLSKKEKKRRRKARNRIKKEAKIKKSQELQELFFDNSDNDYLVDSNNTINNTNTNYIKCTNKIINDNNISNASNASNAININNKNCNNTNLSNIISINSLDNKDIVLHSKKLKSIKINCNDPEVSLSDIVLKIQSLNGSLPPTNTDFNKRKIRQEVWSEHNGIAFEAVCYVDWCTNIINVFNYQVGHDIPKSKGGPNTLKNLKPICESCNQSMSNKYTIKEWNKLFIVPEHKKELLKQYQFNPTEKLHTKKRILPSNSNQEILNYTKNNNIDILKIKEHIEKKITIEEENKQNLVNINNYCKVIVLSSISICLASSIYLCNNLLF